MDSQGFVLLSVITGFNRIRQLTQDVELVRYACLQSRTIEFRTGPDGLDRLRARDGWKQWVLTMEDRDSSARNEGPGQMHQPRMPQPMGMEGYTSRQSLQTSPTEMTHQLPPNDMVYPPATGETVSPNGPLMSPPPMMNGSGTNGDTRHHHPVALSAIVPDFAPANPLAVNGLGITRTESEHDQDTFSDAEVENLVIIVRKQGQGPSKAPFRNGASRTYSNGSIDERMIADAINGAAVKSPERANGVLER